MRNKILVLLLSVFAFASCKHEKKTIEFKKIADLDLGSLSKSAATLHAVAVFTNLTDEEYNLKDMVLDFTIDGKDIGTIVVKTKKVIQPKSEFSIPIEYTFDTKSIIDEGTEPANTYAVELIGDLVAKDAKENELSARVKFATTYEYLTRKEKREARKQAKAEKEVNKNETVPDRKEERQKRREERKAKRNN